jgi:alanyl-tRNA synthetase
MALDDAQQAGAIGLFGEKYDDEVRVVSIGRESVELCGGTHVARAGDIGSFALISETGIAQGVRRVEGVTGMGAVEYAQSLAGVVARASSLLHAGHAQEVIERLERLQRDLKARSAEVGDLKRTLATGGAGSEDTVAEVGGIKLLVKRVAVADPKTMRGAADTLRDRLGSGVVVLGGERDGKANLLVAVTKDLVDRVHAGKLAGILAAKIDGRGGGRPEMAQAGGPNVAALDAALESVSDELAAHLA